MEGFKSIFTWIVVFLLQLLISNRDDVAACVCETPFFIKDIGLIITYNSYKLDFLVVHDGKSGDSGGKLHVENVGIVGI